MDCKGRFFDAAAFFPLAIGQKFIKRLVEYG
jgi:hypothetical protein